MKKILSLLLAFVMVFSMTVFASAHSFNDTYYSKNYEAIEALYGLGILEGYGNGKYGPGNTLTRAEACAIIVRAMVEDDLIYESRTDTFTDIDYFAWYRAYVDTAYRHDYMHGYGKTFGPNDNVTYAQFATIVLNMLGYNCPKLPGEWPENAVEYAKYLGLYYNVSKHDNDDSIYREDVAQMLYNALDCDMVKWVNGKMVKTGSTLAEFLGANYTTHIHRMYDWEYEKGYVKYRLEEDGLIDYWHWCEVDSFDTRIQSGDYVEITYDYLGRTVSVDFYWREIQMEVAPVEIEGVVLEIERYENENLKSVALDGKGTHYFADEYVVENPEKISFNIGVIATLTIVDEEVVKISFVSNPDWNPETTPEINPDPSNGADDVLDNMGV